MQSEAWAELLRLIPPALRENLALTTLTGAEIALQSIVRADRDYLVIRGRMTGTTEGHGLFIIPFDKLSHLSFPKSVNEAEVRALFEQAGQAPAIAPSAAGLEATASRTLAASELSPQTADLGPGAQTPTSSPTDAADPGSSGVDKAALLERLRNRRPATPPVKASAHSQVF
jgi:hypothetical protein